MKRMELIAYNFARLRSKHDWTQAECAEKGEVSNGYIGGIESGHAKSFGAEAEEKWAQIFGVSISEFFLEPGQVITDAEKLMEMIGSTKGVSAGELFRQKQAELRKKFDRTKRKKTA